MSYLGEMSTPPDTYCYPATVVSIYDGDTVTMRVDVGFGWSKEKVKCRIQGIDTPEYRGASEEEKVLSRAAKAFLSELLSGAELIILRSMTKPDKYGRSIVALWADGKDVSQLMIEAGHARAYDGGTKQPWA